MNSGNGLVSAFGVEYMKIKYFFFYLKWNEMDFIESGKKNIEADIQSSFDFIFIDFSGSKINASSRWSKYIVSGK